MIEYDRKCEIRNCAASFLLKQPVLYQVFDIRDMILPDHIILSSFSDYAKIIGINPSRLHADTKLLDGYTVRYNNFYIILYDADYESQCPQRLRFSLAHELGHVMLEHHTDSAIEEEEANYYASQVVAPDCIVLPVLTCNRQHDISVVREHLCVSWETASIKVSQVNRNVKSYSKTEILLNQRYYKEANHRFYRRNKFQSNSLILNMEADDLKDQVYKPCGTCKTR